MKKFFAIIAIAALSSLGISSASNAVTTNPAPVCYDGTCYVTFDYSGDYYYWAPPTGINSLHFDVYGAQGGRLGGKGGQVTGDFQYIPTGLYIYPGGAGNVGNAAAGGFNGGGTAGSGHADAGAGGGASDIRTSTGLSDRIVVAGGGGGFGGWIGGAGGAGGLTIASAGTKGATATTSGGGGSQIAGGSAGLGVTTGNGTAGSSGAGGTGGSGTVAGGGGGGGGYFGGGGGGSDNLSGGSDGAGGGGGSSFAVMALTANVVHQAGTRSGNGVVILRYTYAPKVSYFTPASNYSTTGNVTYQLGFDQFVYDLDQYDFQFSGTASGSCYFNNIFGDGYNFTLQLSNCANGTLSTSLRPNSVLGATVGPTTLKTATDVTIDNVNPGFKIEPPISPNSESTLKFKITTDEPVQNIDATAVGVMGDGCLISRINQITNQSFEVLVNNCAAVTSATLYINARTVRDLGGNLGPSVNVYSSPVQVDRQSPAVVKLQAGSPIADLIPFEVTFSESVAGISSNSFLVGGTGCSLSRLEGGGAEYLVWLVGCTQNPTVAVKALSSSDLAGNLGPITDTQTGTGIIDEVAPAVTITEKPRTAKSESPVFVFLFSEPVQGFTINSLVQNGTAKNCTFTLTEIASGTNFELASSNCQTGTLKLTLPAKSVTDSNRNLGPESNVDSPVAKIDLTQSNDNQQAAAPAAVDWRPSEPVDGTPLVQTPPLVTSPKVKPTTEQNDLATFATTTLNSVGPQGWLSIGIATVALFIARRRGGSHRQKLATQR